MIHVLSHREIDDEAVSLQNLIVNVVGHELSSPEYVPDWDHATPLKIRAEVFVELNKCWETAGLDTGTDLGLSLVWHSSGSGLRGASTIQTVRDGRNDVSIDFEGFELGGTLTIQIVVTLLGAPTERRPLAAHRPGSRLRGSEKRIRLEGAGSRFPISHVSFAETGLAGGLPAAWLVLFESKELYDSGVGNMRLYMNTDHEHVRDYVADPDLRPDLGHVLRADVNRQVVLHALQAEDLDPTATYPSESMGELLAMSFNRNFPGRTVEEIQAMLKNSPGEFEAHLQARGGFLA
ncbi:MAG: hypothetical protein EOP29_30120 [Rhodococcus sp. (in: high G+C Gram-positive bacteria)]|nr:MAG: hypothetical protein EOP29_30120 [Rhodococcus sp. (in: high G+C Gram-positive bacteria)]